MIATALLLMGSGSGCGKSDVQDLMEILAGSQGIGAVEYGEHLLGTGTGDKGKDELLETAEVMEKIKKAKELEDAAAASMAESPPDSAKAAKALDDAIALRPDDWGLRNQLATLHAEQGRETAGEFANSSFRCEGRPEPERLRCWDRNSLDQVYRLELSVERMKGRDKTVPCAVYKALVQSYESYDLGHDPNDATKSRGRFTAQVERLRQLLKASACDATPPPSA